MENYSNYSSYPDSRDSSPRSRDVVDDGAASWDDTQPPSQQQQQSYKAKFMCSYGGKIQPRPHDNQLAYIGGDTKILSVDRSIKLPAFLSKLASVWPLAGDDICFKYQLPGEDLDALISVTNEEDLDHMMIEYDRLHRASSKPARLRLFLFAAGSSNHLLQPQSEKNSSSERQWFVDALNSVQIQPTAADSSSSSPPAPQPPPSSAHNNPDFLFGFDKQAAGAAVTATTTVAAPEPVATPGSECGSEEQSAAEIQRQIQELQRLQIVAQEQAMQRKYEEIGNPRGYGGVGGGGVVDYYSQSLKVQEKLAPSPTPPLTANAPPQVPMQVQMPIPGSYVSERHIPPGGYHVAPPPQQQPQTGMEQPVYLIQTPSGVYHHHHHQAAAPMRPMTGPVGQPFYGVHQRAVPEGVYREAAAAQVYNPAPNQGFQIMQPPPPQQQVVPPPQKAEQTGFTQVGYDSSGRQVYYTTTTTAAAATTTAYQNVVPVSGGGGGSGGSAGALNQEGKVIAGKPSQSSAVM